MKHGTMHLEAEIVTKKQIITRVRSRPKEAGLVVGRTQALLDYIRMHPALDMNCPAIARRLGYIDRALNVLMGDESLQQQGE